MKFLEFVFGAQAGFNYLLHFRIGQRGFVFPEEHLVYEPLARTEAVVDHGWLNAAHCRDLARRDLDRIFAVRDKGINGIEELLPGKFCFHFLLHYGLRRRAC